MLLLKNPGKVGGRCGAEHFRCCIVIVAYRFGKSKRKFTAWINCLSNMLESGRITLLLQNPQQGGGEEAVQLVSEFILSVMASVVAYYICKWLDGRK